MGDKTGIEWTDTTWNPVRGCSRVSAGCMNCYAERQAIRQINSGYAGLVKRTSHGPAWTGEVVLVANVLEQAQHWSGARPRRIFVNSMSDMFHENLSDDSIMEVLCAIDASARTHQFQILTKRAARMQSLLSRLKPNKRGRYALDGFGREQQLSVWPLPNVWLGVSVEDQATADERIPLLLKTPAAVRFVSYEPALGPVDFTAIKHTHSPGYFGDALQWYHQPHGVTGYPALDWVIIGGESGPKARPCDIAWIRSAVEQCKAASVPVFVKQIGAKPKDWCCARLYSDDDVLEDGMCDIDEAHEGPHCGDRCYALNDRKGGDMAEWPEDLRVRQFPGEQQ